MVAIAAFVLLQMLYHMFHQSGRVFCCCLFEGGIVHMSAVIRFVGDGADNNKRNMIQPCGMRNGGSLHFCTKAAGKVFQDVFFDLRAGYKLISADDPAFKYLDFRIYDFAGGSGLGNHPGICGKSQSAELGYFSQRISEAGGIHIVIERICGDNNITDVYGGIQRACHTGINHMCTMNEVG